MSAKLRVVKAEDPDEPIDMYINQVNSETLDTLPYERLMIWYRKQKLYKEELEVINTGINTIKSHYERQQKEVLGNRINAALKALSNKISKSTGLHDKKGNELYLPEPIPKWTKRKSVVEAKLLKSTDKRAPAKKKKSVARKVKRRS